MATYSVQSGCNDFGPYEAQSEQEARDLCAQEAGYKSEADMVAQIEAPSWLVAILVADE